MREVVCFRKSGHISQRALSQLLLTWHLLRRQFAPPLSRLEIPQQDRTIQKCQQTVRSTTMWIRCGLIWLACIGMSGNTVVYTVSSRRFTQVSTAHFLAKSDSLMGVSENIWCPVIGTALYIKPPPTMCTTVYSCIIR